MAQEEEITLGSRKNVLLVKDKLGRAKVSTRDLPGAKFVYGKPDLLEGRETAA